MNIGRLTAAICLAILAEKAEASRNKVIYFQLHKDEMAQLNAKKPKAIGDIQINRGEVLGAEESEATYQLFEQPDAKSPGVLKKSSGSLSVFSGAGKLICQFSSETKEKRPNCFSYFQSQKLSDGEIWSLRFSDYSEPAAQKQEWAKITFGPVSGWYNYTGTLRLSADAPELNHPTNILHLRPGTKIHASLLNKNSKFRVHGNSANDLEVVLMEEGTITWKEGRPFVKIGFAKRRSRDEYCSQSGQLTGKEAGYVELFDKNGQFSIGREELSGDFLFCD